MNITDLIVELLQNGQKVELPEIGTFDSVMQSPHHDPATRIYYPATRAIVFSQGTTGDNAIVGIIAQRECVGMDVALQMWTNYTDALSDKLNRTGEHTFGPLGSLIKRPGGFAFEMAEGVVIEAGGSSETPLSEVRTYTHDEGDDPFAQFDAEPEVTVVQRPEPEPIVETPRKPQAPEASEVAEAPNVAEVAPESQSPAEAPEAEAMVAADEKLDEEWQENLKKLDDLPKSKAALKAEAKAEKARLKAEAKAEKERAKMRKRAQKDHDHASRQAEEDREAVARREADEKRRAEEELRKAEIRAEESRVKAEKEAEAAMKRAEQKAQEERVKAEKRAAALAAVAAAATAEEAATGTAQAVAVPFRPQSDKEAERRIKEEEKRAEAAAKEEARKAEAAAKEEARKAEAAAKEEARKAEAAAKEEARKAEAAAKEEARRLKEEKKRAKAEAKAASKKADEEEGEKKGRRWGLWLLLLLLLLLLGGAVGYLLKDRIAGRGTEAGATARNQHLGVSKANQFTFNTDMLEYGEREISRNSDIVSQNMADYVNTLLAEQGYRNARVPMMDRVRQYAGERLGELMGSRFAAQRFIPYDDYVYTESEPWLRRMYAGKSRNTVQGELMDGDLLDRMLDEVISDYNLLPDDAYHAEPAAAPVAAPAKATPKVTLPTDDPVYVYVEKKSKQGFDIVAGFYLNKATAAKMTARLHELGSDAYIIEKNDMYYVSMGSAPTRTKAEALYNHIKSWYDGDIVIKQLD